MTVLFVLLILAYHLLLYYYNWMFDHTSQPKKFLTQNVFLLNFQISFEFFLIKNFQIDEHPVVIVQYH